MLRAMQQELAATLERLVAETAEARATLGEIARALQACRERLAGVPAARPDEPPTPPPAFESST